MFQGMSTLLQTITFISVAATVGANRPASSRSGAAVGKVVIEPGCAEWFSMSTWPGT